MKARFYTAAALIGFLLVSTVQAQEAAPLDIPASAEHVNTGNGAINWSTYPYPVDNTSRSPNGYPIFLIECNHGQCVGPTGQAIGDEKDVAYGLPPIRVDDAKSAAFRCNYVCFDAQQNLIGSNPLRLMRTGPNAPWVHR